MNTITLNQRLINRQALKSGITLELVIKTGFHSNVYLHVEHSTKFDSAAINIEQHVRQ